MKNHYEKVKTFLASFGKVIIVGRGGACLTRELPGGIHLRLVSPLEYRVKTMMGLLSLSEKGETL